MKTRSCLLVVKGPQLGVPPPGFDSWPLRYSHTGCSVPGADTWRAIWPPTWLV
ncbi:unnamed protein product [Arabidopsis halleri]